MRDSRLVAVAWITLEEWKKIRRRVKIVIEIAISVSDLSRAIATVCGAVLLSGDHLECGEWMIKRNRRNWLKLIVIFKSERTKENNWNHGGWLFFQRLINYLYRYSDDKLTRFRWRNSRDPDRKRGKRSREMFLLSVCCPNFVLIVGCVDSSSVSSVAASLW